MKNKFILILIALSFSCSIFGVEKVKAVNNQDVQAIIASAMALSGTGNNELMKDLLRQAIAILTQRIQDKIRQRAGGTAARTTPRNTFRENAEIETVEAEDISDEEATLLASLELNDAEFSRVWFEWGEDDDEMDENTDIKKTQQSGLVKIEIDDLDEGQRYFYQAWSKDSLGKMRKGGIESFEAGEVDEDDEDAEVDVETLSATDIEDEEAELRGEVELDRTDYAYVWFEWGEDRDDLDEDTDREKLTRDDDFDFVIEDLDEGEKYYFRAVARDDSGEKSFGRIKSFVAGDEDSSDDEDDDYDEPDVTTEDADSIGEDEAELVADIELNDADYVYLRFYYGEDEDDLEDRSDREKIDEDGEYSIEIDGLDEDIRYYFQAVIEDQDDDEFEGDIEDFRTEENDYSAAEVSTEEATGIRDDEADLVADIDLNDADYVYVWFEWGEDEDDLDEETDREKVRDDGEYEIEIDGLDPDTEYYFQAFIEDSEDEEDEGRVESFRTEE